MYRIGGQRLGIERDIPVLDDEEHPVFSEFGQPLTAPVLVWVDGCLFEVPQAPDEQQGTTVTTSEVGWAVIPIGVDAVVAAVDADGDPAPIAFFDGSGNPAISSSARIRHNGLVYAMRGDAVLERDMRGRPDHVFCRCERERG
ncbi:MAG TPA: hypothetical protein PLF91_00175 [Mycolicibacterium fallax]|nr:hypothetical protein [Mycolicibacterium fallax]